MIVALGIDQGLANLGYGVITLDENPENNDIKVLTSGTSRTSSKKELPERLVKLYKDIDNLIKEYNSDIMGCEKLFVNPRQKSINGGKGRNKSASIVVTSNVTGIIFLLAGVNQTEIKDFSPGTVKKAVTGSGRATKQEVMEKVYEICREQGIEIKTEHQADAIAIAITSAIYLKNKKLEEKNE